MIEARNKLAKRRMVLAGWHIGTRSREQPGTQAMRDLMDKWLMLRCETSALANILIAKGVTTADELTRECEAEAKLLDADMERAFPGYRSTPAGIEIYDARLAAETNKRLGFPP